MKVPSLTKFQHQNLAKQCLAKANEFMKLGNSERQDYYVRLYEVHDKVSKIKSNLQESIDASFAIEFGKMKNIVKKLGNLNEK